MALDIAQIIKDAKLGVARKDAQIDACEPFACALRDVLKAHGIEATDITASFFVSGKSRPEWCHAVVEVKGVLFDSMGVFSHDVVRTRQKTHKAVQTRLVIEPDIHEVDENDWSEMYAFCLKKLEVSAKAAIRKDCAEREVMAA